MSEIRKPAPKTRRDVLRTASQGAGAAAGGVVGVVVGTPGEAAAETSAAATGYRETEHVKRYYKLAGF